MKAVKLFITVLALGVMASTPLLRAQDDKAPPADSPKAGKGGKGGGRATVNAEDRIAAIDQAVGGLSADQKAKIKDVLAKSQEQMQGLRGGAGGDRQAARAKMQEINKSTHDQIRDLLASDDQKTKFDAMPTPGRGGKGGKKKT